MSIWWYMPYLWHCQITFSPRVTEWLLSAGDRAQHITLCWVTNQCIIQLRPIKLYNSNGGIVMWPMLVAGQPVLLTNTRGMISCPPDCSTDNRVSLLCYKKKKNLIIVAQKNVRLRLWGISHSQDVNTAAAKRARNLSLFMLMRLVGSAVNGESIGELEWHLGTTLGAVTISGCSFLVKKKKSIF